MSTRRCDIRASVPVDGYFEQQYVGERSLTAGGNAEFYGLSSEYPHLLVARLTGVLAAAASFFTITVYDYWGAELASTDVDVQQGAPVTVSLPLAIPVGGDYVRVNYAPTGHTDVGGATVEHSVSLALYRLVERYELPLMVDAATITLDETWSPYAQASLECAPPPDGGALVTLDPRADRRVRMSLGSYFGTTWPITRLDIAIPGGAGAPANVTAWLGGRGVRAFAEEFSRPYSEGDMRPSIVRHLDLMMRTRSQVDSKTSSTLRVEAMSDEAALQDVALVATSPESPAGTALSDAVDLALGRIGAVLGETHDATSLEADSLAWEPGVSGWDYISPLVQTSGRRLWCDERRGWRLTDPLATVDGGVRITARKVVSETIDRDSEDWCEAVVVEYRWTNGAGVELVRYDTAGPANASKVRTVHIERPYVRPGAAAAILRRLQGRGYTIETTAVLDPRIAPGQPTVVTLPDGRDFVGIVSRVEFRMPACEMSVVLRDAEETIAGTYGSIPPDITYGDIPSGVSWEDFMAALAEGAVF